MGYLQKHKSLLKLTAMMLSVLLSIAALQWIAVPVQVMATTVGELDEDISDVKDTISGYESQLKELNDLQNALLLEMEAAQAKVAEYQTQIDALTAEIAALDAEIARLNGEIEEVTAQIEQKEKEITQKQAELDAAEELFRDRLAAMYMMSGNLTIMNVLFGAADFSDFLMQTQMLDTISESDTELMNEITAFKEELQRLKLGLEDDKRILEETKVQVEAVKTQVATKQAEVIALRDVEQQEADIAEAARLSSLDKLAQAEALLHEQESELATLEAEREEMINSQIVDSGGSTSTGTPPAPSASGWTNPMTEGYSYISTYFNVVDAWHSRPHGGVDFAAPYGRAIAATRSGTVSSYVTGWGGGYGNYLIVNHGDGYYSLYAHCQTLLVSQGQSVSQGQKIAEVGSTGNSTGPHLHFEIRYGTQKLNPLNYINA